MGWDWEWWRCRLGMGENGRMRSGKAMYSVSREGGPDPGPEWSGGRVGL